MRNDIRNTLIDAAKRRAAVPYKTIMDRFHVNRVQIGGVLSEIAEFEHAHQRPMLTSIVVHSNSGDEHCPQGEPGTGFLGLDWLRREKPTIARKPNNMEKKPTPAEKRLCRAEQLKAFEYWAGHEDTVNTQTS